MYHKLTTNSAHVHYKKQENSQAPLEIDYYSKTCARKRCFNEVRVEPTTDNAPVRFVYPDHVILVLDGGQHPFCSYHCLHLWANSESSARDECSLAPETIKRS